LDPGPGIAELISIETYVDRNGLFGRRGYQGLHWHCTHLLQGVDPKGGHTLEVGAGSGSLSLWLLGQGARSATLLEPEAAGSTVGTAARAAGHGRSLGLDADRWRFRNETLQRHQPDRRYRLVLSQNSVNHLDEDACVRLLNDPAASAAYRTMFRKIHDMLEPGGWLVIADCARTNYWSWLGKRSPWAYMIEWEKHQEPETWAGLLRAAGFEIEALRWWHPYFRVRALQPIIRFRTASRFLSSYFVLRARRPPGAPPYA
jgi:SAM-dependent methyltransferase